MSYRIGWLLRGFLIVSVLAGMARAQATQPHRRILLITESKGFVHEVVKRQDGKPNLVEQTFGELAKRTKLFDVEGSQDSSIITPEKLKGVDLVVFYTTGDLAMSNEQLDAFDQWLKAGGRFMGIHPATNTFEQHPIYPKIVGGVFDGHPWTQDVTVTIKVLEPNHPAAKPWGQGDTFKEEIYQTKQFDPSSVRVLIALDMEKTEMKKSRFIPISWCKEYGKGKVFYTSLGHRPDMWMNPKYQDHLIGGIRWLWDLDRADATPNPKVSAAEEEIAKKAAEKQTGARVPDNFKMSTFVKAPEIHSPASIAVTPDGNVFVGEDEYNTQPKRDQGLSRVKFCVDTDRDGKADRITVFADKINSPQGMCYAGGTLYVAHAPLLTALRDTNGDGVADERVDLATGFGPVPEGLVHHVPSGLHMGIDGWLYCSIGDKGILKATGKDGRTVSLWGGGVVRIRPDGTMMEVFSYDTRNTFDVSVGPYLDAFTRDNTNDGNGWASRLTQMQRDGEYGYPRLFKNYADEMIPCVDEYGSGSATGSCYVHEPFFPGTTGDCLYTCDWARGIIYRHDLTRVGATFKATAEEFAKGFFATDVDVDGIGHLYLCNWGRRDWSNSAGQVGEIYRVQPIPTSTQPAAPKKFPDMRAAGNDELLEHLISRSMIRRLEAQQEILRRGRSSDVEAKLTNLAMKRGELYGRVAALFTIAQLMGEDVNSTLATLGGLPELREFALRALSDYDNRLHLVNTNLFVTSLTDANPRVRAQAAVGIGHLKQPKLAASLVPVTADADIMVRHAAMQSIRRLGAADVCISAIQSSRDPNVVTGALRTLRSFHDDQTFAAVSDLMKRDNAPAMRQEIVKALARLYHVEAKWDGTWWTPHPDTRGPYYVAESWARSADVARLMLTLAEDHDTAVATMALNYVGMIEMKEGLPTLVRLISGGGILRNDAAKALIAMNASTPESLNALERIILADIFAPDVRASAAQSLASSKTPEAQAMLIRIAGKLDITPKLPAGLLDKVADSLSSRAPAADKVTSMLPLLRATQQPLRLAAAAALLRVKDQPSRDKVMSVWKTDDAAQLEAMLTSVTRIPADASKPYRKEIASLLRDDRVKIRQAATIALGHLGDASAVTDLVALAKRDPDPIPAVSALAGIAPDKTSDEQVLLVATLLVESSAKISKTGDKQVYARLLGAAQKFLGDPRVPSAKAASLRSRLMEPGVIYSYQRTDAIPVPSGDKGFAALFPPEATPAGPFVPFSVEGKAVPWKPLLVNDPQGIAPLEMPASSVVYLTATYESPAAGSGWLGCGSDDGIQVWVNGKPVISRDIDRGMKPDTDHAMVQLRAGTNTLLLKVNNRGDGSGVQARLRSRVPEFDADELLRVTRKIPSDVQRGRELFTSVGCVKCHTTDRHEEPKGPFLGDVGSKFDAKYICESVLTPSAKIAQGFGSELLITGAGASKTEYLGFITRETAQEIQIRDLTGKVSVVQKDTITKRAPQVGSMMPTGLADNLSIDDFSALMTFLQSMK